MSVAKSKEYYNERYASDYRINCSGFEKARSVALETFIKKYCSHSKFKKVLDYGVGNGLHVNNWKKIFYKADLYFCDISSVARDQFCNKYPQFSANYYLNIDNQSCFNDDMFDCVISIEVMEHVESLKEYIIDIQRILKPGGTFIWTTPCANSYSIEHILSFITMQIEKTEEGYRKWRWEDPSHVRRMKSKEMSEILTKNGFEEPIIEFRAHLFSFLCTHIPILKRIIIKDFLLNLDYKLFKKIKSGASMIGYAKKNK